MTHVKICGLMNQRDVNLCVEAGVDMVGFVVDYPAPVPWNLSIDEAAELMKMVPASVKSCVVTGGSVGKVLDMVGKIKPDVVQLHYKETLHEVKEIAGSLKVQGIETIKALRIDCDGKCDFEISDPALAARELSLKTEISAILVDSYTEAIAGGTGVRVDLSIFEIIKKNSSLPVILAGGLNPTNIHSLISEVDPDAVDVLTGVEEKSGKKDERKVREFINNARLSSARNK
jgi:phosphoribosylanthranilate isomerase